MKRRDDGATLVELLVTIVILGVIIGAITTAFAFALRNVDDTTRRVSQSQDAQLLSAYWLRDVHSSESVGTTPATCGGPQSGETQAIWFAWAEQPPLPGDPAASAISSYVVRADGGERTLVRRRCTNGAIVNAVVVVHQMLASSPALTCAPSACGADPEPARVSIAVTAPAPQGPAGGPSYSYEVSARRRIS